MLKLFETIDKSLSSKITGSFLITIILSIALISGMAYIQSYKLLTEHLGKRSMTIAEIAAEKIDTEAFKKLKSVKDEKTNAYQKMKKDLSELRMLTGTQYLYTMTKNNNGEYVYVLDGSAEEDLSHIGDVEDNNPVFESVFEGKPYIGSKIEKSEWGTLLSSYLPIKDKEHKIIGFVGVDYDVAIEYQAFQRYKTILIVVIVSLIFIMALFSMSVARKIIKPLNQLTETMKQAETGDLEAHAETYLKDEIGALSISFNKMMEHIREMFDKVNEASGELIHLSHELSIAAGKINHHTNEISMNVSGIAAGMQQTAASIQEVTASSNEIGIDLKTLLDKANSCGKVIKEIKKRAEEMKEHAEVSSSLAAQIYKEKQSQAIEAIDKGKIVLEIKGIAKLVSSLSEKINLIAVNAAIEAARAGNSGAGFAVVAEEIRNLANKSSAAVKSIDELVKEVQQAFNHLSGVSQGMLEFIDNKVINDYKVLVSTGGQYLEDAEHVEIVISHFIGYSKGIIEAVDQVNRAMESVAAAVEQTTVSLQEISNSTDQTVKETEIVVEIADIQVGHTNKLSKLLIKLFRR